MVSRFEALAIILVICLLQERSWEIVTPNVVSESDFLRMDPQKWILFKIGFVLLRDKCKKKVLVALNYNI